MQKKTLKKQIKNIQTIWEASTALHKKYTEEYYDENIGPQFSQPAWNLAESLVEDLTGVKVSKSPKKGWVEGEYLPEKMIEHILYNKGSVKELMEMAEKLKANL